MELGNKIVDLVLGKKVEGRIAAVLPKRDNQLRYVVDTGEDFLQVQIPVTRFYTTIVPLPPAFEDELLRNQKVKRRFFNVRRWTDGQVI